MSSAGTLDREGLVPAFGRAGRRLLDEIRNQISTAEEPGAALAAVVSAHADFAIDERELLAMWRQEFANLPPEDQSRLRKLRHLYVSEWVRVLMAVRADFRNDEARAAVYGAIAILQSPNEHNSGLPREVLKAMLTSMALSALYEASAPGGEPRGLMAIRDGVD